jgi:hypothetical protein
MLAGFHKEYRSICETTGVTSSVSRALVQRESDVAGKRLQRIPAKKMKGKWKRLGGRGD